MNQLLALNPGKLNSVSQMMRRKIPKIYHVEAGLARNEGNPEKPQKIQKKNNLSVFFVLFLTCLKMIFHFKSPCSYHGFHIRWLLIAQCSFHCACAHKLSILVF